MASPFARPVLRRRSFSAVSLPDGSALVYHPGVDTTYPLNESAALIWNLCDGNRTIEQIAAELAENYDASPEQLSADVERFLEELQQLDLLTTDPPET